MGIDFIDMSFAARYWDTGVMSLIVMSKVIKGIFKKQSVQSLFIDELSKKLQQIQITVSLLLAMTSVYICVNTVSPPILFIHLKKKNRFFLFWCTIIILFSVKQSTRHFRLCVADRDRECGEVFVLSVKQTWTHIFLPGKLETSEGSSHQR